MPMLHLPRVVLLLTAMLSFLLAAGTAAAAIPAGTVTQFSAGLTGNAGLGSVTAGPDGNLWFTETNHNAIGRISPDGGTVASSPRVSPRGPGHWESRRARTAICGSPRRRGTESGASRRLASSRSSRSASRREPVFGESRRAPTATCGSQSRSATGSGGLLQRVLLPSSPPGSPQGRRPKASRPLQTGISGSPNAPAAGSLASRLSEPSSNSHSSEAWRHSPLQPDTTAICGSPNQPEVRSVESRPLVW